MICRGCHRSIAVRAFSLPCLRNTLSWQNFVLELRDAGPLVGGNIQLRAFTGLPRIQRDPSILSQDSNA